MKTYRVCIGNGWTFKTSEPMSSKEAKHLVALIEKHFTGNFGAFIKIDEKKKTS